jgi:hypothetical protein
MSLTIETQTTLTESLIDDHLLTWVEAFLIDRIARGVAEGTLKFYPCHRKDKSPAPCGSPTHVSGRRGSAMTVCEQF